MSDALTSQSSKSTEEAEYNANALTFTNAKVVLPDEVIDGSIDTANGLIRSIDSGNAAQGHDCEGDYLIPGLVELHTDHLENHYKPRPGVLWNPISAVQAHDAQIACAGITTVLDALRVGMDDGADFTAQDMRAMADAIETAQAAGRLRADHFLHLRCEVSADNCVEGFSLFEGDDRVRLTSLMDHTPGQRQFTSLDYYIKYYKEAKGFSDEQLEVFIEHMTARGERNSDKNRREIAARATASGIQLASHDDATVAHVEEGVGFGIKVAEFPTTMEAAKASTEAGMAVLMGAPNVVRGKSHSGNISAKELASAGYLNILSSDYVPVSLLHGAFVLAKDIEGITLPDAIQKVTKIPAESVSLMDRGAIIEGRRADLVQVRMVDDIPIVRGVWREGRRVA
ncbi:alpha-D-ribose 1-methylphosphonate 5-triphosphate diphosphatase [Pseudovibrio sp. SPO723]|uniref:alpha-D-ribose 1-methylphosphonate 5-triphosphate diphosphatase n=1 Tax=Nesiotobacter zosterae TaxID=392721 RepID=UPI0029C2E171|nr:alpha-D-ribose 1-methylphosphonate 5-triphosphate diphosphatase [Pseudovibrio sp. SPO723]MDX5594775.1 alpha-D-ribose 1-methylphosphonate 5-triphosphate diphosphatase [Pseudovibrio sp. SPO723]